MHGRRTGRWRRGRERGFGMKVVLTAREASVIVGRRGVKLLGRALRDEGLWYSAGGWEISSVRFFGASSEELPVGEIEIELSAVEGGSE